MAMDKMKLPCGHMFCKKCITEWLKRATICPYCRSNCTICHLCGELVESSIMTRLCGHTFCRECVIARLEKEQRCPECCCMVNAYMHEGSMVYLDLDLRMMLGLVIDEDDGSWPEAWRNPSPFVLNDF